jgi:hypothetical protein
MKCECQTEGHGHKAGECPNEAEEVAFCERCFTLNNAEADRRREESDEGESA